jgi:hypothetical protein
MADDRTPPAQTGGGRRRWLRTPGMPHPMRDGEATRKPAPDDVATVDRSGATESSVARGGAEEPVLTD